MLRLLLLRHAKSDWSDAAQIDFDRPLNIRGQRAAPQMGAHMARHGLVPDKVLCSSARRTRETLGLILPHLSGNMEIRVTRDLYEDGELDYVDSIRALGGGARTVLVIGHNPAMQDTALELIGEGNPALRESIATKFPTAALAVVDFAINRWSDAERGSGRVVAYCLPRQLPGGALPPLAATPLGPPPLAANDGGNGGGGSSEPE
ncbi:SixA phosphatase family protein [Stappia indica]|uniref:SixA phosphatase family protein n=1 Tax=Stappia indica TaxID=538381 RepID=UPI001CD53D68|nr:histidine phosphatase family protein [Stappia indica]MCA1298853.1 histidine phosphatase family protein [Stappia indica]